MSAPAFTPGPWRIRENGRHAPDECDLSICGDIFVLCDISGPNYAHCEANARLIAAAPELYDSIDVANLRKAAELIRFAGSTIHAGLLTMMADKQERALAKARGEQ